MAALNHSTIIKGLEKLIEEKNSGQFFFDFLKVFKFPAATIKRLQEANSNRNIAIAPGDYGLTKSIYFHPAQNGEDLRQTITSLVNSPALQKHQIRFFLTTNFVDVVAYDKRVDDWTSFAFEDLRENYEFFLPLSGLYEKPLAYTSHPADVKACEKMGRLYDIIRTLNHYDASNIHELNVFLTRLLFCFFAEDTEIFPKSGQMTAAIESLTQADGSDLSEFFSRLFAILDARPEDPLRQSETTILTAFPYVNGGLFREQCRVPTLNAKARTLLLECGKLEWNQISPVIFGSMFQSVMDPEARHERGAHYTSEENILRVIGPLFLDALKRELESLLLDQSTHRVKRLKDFQERLANLKFFDPACGCGNFLIVAYREIKKLELSAAKVIFSKELKDRSVLDDWTTRISRVTINQFYGIEIEEFPVDIARVSMWLMEHVINREFSDFFGQAFPSIPLTESVNIIQGNALRLDWESALPIKEINYIFGNPPFSGYKKQNQEQKNDLRLYFKSKKIDYISGWLYKSAAICSKYKSIEVAFVSTNSITQGEQVANIWGEITSKFPIHLKFAHKTFEWKNEAPHSASVHVVIIGFSSTKSSECWLISENGRECVEKINFYLLDLDNLMIKSRSTPICNVEPMIYGSEPRDGNYLIFTSDEYCDTIKQHPETKRYFRRYCSAEDFTSGNFRYCLWLTYKDYLNLKQIELFESRFNNCKQYRENSKQKGAHAAKSRPYEFTCIRQPKSRYLLIPIATTSNRDYIPISYVDPDTICSNACFTIENASLFTFGILNSWMHIVWVNSIGGKLKSDFRYSNQIIYNNFPWPKFSENQKELIETLSQNILLVREYYPEKSLADLYDRSQMPDELRRAHHELDLAVDRLYRKKPFANDDERLRHLFVRYEKLISGEDDADLLDEE